MVPLRLHPGASRVGQVCANSSRTSHLASPHCAIVCVLIETSSVVAGRGVALVTGVYSPEAVSRTQSRQSQPAGLDQVRLSLAATLATPDVVQQPFRPAIADGEISSLPRLGHWHYVA